MIIGLPQQLAKLTNPCFSIDHSVTLLHVPSARNLGVLLDSHLTFDKHISNITKSCIYHLRDLRRIRCTLDFKTASTIATSLVQSKLDYCNSLFLNLPAHQINRLQLIQNSMARVVTGLSRSEHISSALQSLHWLKIKQRIEYKVLSLTYSAIQYDSPHYLRRLLVLQEPRSTHSSSFVVLRRPPTSGRQVEGHSFYYAAPALWNSLPTSLRCPVARDTELPSLHNKPVLSLTRRQFLSRLKTFLFTRSYPP